MKFRVWNTSEGEMLYPGPLTAQLLCIQLGGSLIEYQTHGFLYSSDCVLMRSTELIDKNNTEIYEGDLVAIGRV